MKKLMMRISAWIFTLEMCVLGGVPAYAATYTNTKGMGKFFEKVYDAIFGESLDSFFEKHREEIQLRIKTGIIITLLVIVVCILLVTYFLVTKKRERVDEDEDDEDGEDEDGSEQELDVPDDLDRLEDE